MRAAFVLCALALLLGSSLAGRPGAGDPRIADNRVAADPIAGEMQVVDADTRIYVYHNFLTEEECEHLKNRALKRLSRSVVVDPNTHESVEDPVRTSSGMFFDRAEDPIIERVERRLAQWTLTPIHNGEGLQVLRYENLQKYEPHLDYLDEAWANGGNRYKTVLMYLEAAELGGETIFPEIPAPGGINANFSDCAKYHLAVKPKKGDAILFHSMTPGGAVEKRSMHGACPVLKGEKWSMTKWIREKPFGYQGDKYDRELWATQADQAKSRRVQKDNWVSPEL